MPCKIAVLDSGISNFYDSRVLYKRVYTGIFDYDENGHGTKCVAVMQNNAPDTEFIILKLLDKNLQCSSDVLCQALYDLQRIDVDIINLSLSTFNVEKSDEINALCGQLYNQGKIIVASKSNKAERSFPAESKYVIGVEGELFTNESEIWFNPHNEIQCIASKTPILIKMSNTNYSFFGGNSKAAAYISALYANNWADIKDSSIQEKFDLLSKTAVKSVWSDEELVNDIVFPKKERAVFNFINSDIYIVLKWLFMRICNIDLDEIPMDEPLINLIGLNQLEEILNGLVKQYDLEIENLNLYDCLTIQRICNRVMLLKEL